SPLAQGTPGKQCGLAATGDYQPSLRSPWLAADVNGDQMTDLICQVYTAQFMIEPGEASVMLEAETEDGMMIRGEDSVQIVPDH
ncbi:MAG: hypothetical protein JMN26_14360, partial [gamma proteobacterium endosymbiont of Lamellibrachia anaximandri]|nr:hypothetical protein [gamma proteobacterium endosymbiont of Lamellibrachia anaximandri]